MRVVQLELGGETKEFPLGVSILLYGSVGSGKTTFSLTLAKEFLAEGMPCVWICLDESPKTIRDKMSFFKIDHEKYERENQLRIIDIYSEQITGFPFDDPYVINCSSAFNLNEVNRSLMTALSQVQGQGIVIFDSVSTLLLYNKSSTCEEFLKVHMSRITTAGFTGFFILQRDLHTTQTEETLKMMSDSVLEFGFAKEGRQIGVSKLPLGTAGDWIESSLFSWQQPVAVTAAMTGGRKVMDSGGYIEDIKEGVAEGVKGALEEIRKHEDEQEQPERRRSRSEPEDPDDLSGKEKAWAKLTEEMAKAFEKGFSNIKLEAPNLKELKIEKETMEKLSTQIQGMSNQHASLVDKAREHEQLSRENREKLDHLANQEHRTSIQVKDIDEKTRALLSVVEEKRSHISETEKKLAKEKERYEKALQDKKASNLKAESLRVSSKKLEDKIKMLLDSTEGMDIDISPYIAEMSARLDQEVESAKKSMEALAEKIEASNTEIQSLERQIVENAEAKKSKAYELETVRTEKVKVQSELSLITTARKETEEKLSTLAESRKKLEEQLKSLVEDSTDDKG